VEHALNEERTGGKTAMAVVIPTSTESEALQQADVPGITRPMTYEEYLSGPEMARYDIIDGWKVYRLYGGTQLANPTRKHQEIQGNLFLAFHDFERKMKQGKVILAPCDVRITYQPLHCRQPDLLFISQERLDENPPADNPAPLAPAPELVVEIASPSDKPGVLAAKIADYRAAGVQEVWVMRTGEQRIEVVQLSPNEIVTIGDYAQGQIAQSSVFPELQVSVDAIFEEGA
jgi:Uma2 family endonuclease